MEYRDKKFKSKLKTHGGAYRSKIRIDKEEIKERYKRKRVIELGEYRHNARCINYDEIVKRIIEKWEKRDEKLCLEIIHSVQNKANAMILESIIEADREIR